MNKTMKKALALVLMMIMVLSSVPMTSFAAGCSESITGLHNWIGSSYVVTKAATCSEKGVETRYCKNGCGTAETREIAINPKAHKEVAVSRVEATCDEYGNEAGVICGLCNAVISGYAKITPTGHKETTLAAKAATCTEDGNKAGTKCSVCNKTLTGGAVIAKTGHAWELYSKKPATCTTPGEQVDICKNCSLKSEVKTIEASHSWGSWRTVTAATCSAKGKTERSCTMAGCNATESKDIDKLAHTIETVVAKSPTCTEAGITAGERCKVCKETIKGAETIPAKGHTAVVVAGVPATCTTAGKSESSYCSVCELYISKAVTIQATGHNMVADTANSKAATCTTTGIEAKKCTNTGCTYTETKTLPLIHEANWTVTKKVTCTEDGARRGTCKKCGMDVTEVIPATGHKVTNDSSWRVSKSATCTEAGTKTATCETCGKTATKSIPATGHNETVKTAAVAATCTKEGQTESKHCSKCGLVTVAAEKVEKLAHTYSAWTVDVAATCQVAGVEKATCTVCKTETKRATDKLPHTEKVIEAVAATCTEAGSTAGAVCSVCNTKIKDTAKIDALGHDYVMDQTAYIAPTCDTAGREKGKCSRCNAEKDEVIAALGHTEEIIKGTAPDCTNSGIQDGKQCTVCKRVLQEQITLEALGHDFIIDPNKSTAATCTEKGYSYAKCSRCDTVDAKDVAPIDHVWGEWTESLKASCEAQGEEKRECANCKTIDVQSIPSLGGHVVVTSPGKDATCTESGLTAGSKCERCDTIFEPQDEIAPLGHILGEQKEITKKATFTEDGEYGYRCTVCDGSVDVLKIAKIDEASIKLAATTYYYNGKTKTPAVTVKDTDGNELVKGTDYEVAYDAGRKNTGKYNVEITFIGNYEGEKTLTFTINPVKSAKVSYTNKGDHILITWDKVEGATGYTIYIYQNSESGTKRKALKTVAAGTTSYKLTKDYNGKALNYDESYRIGIVSRTKTEDGVLLLSKNPAFCTATRKLVKPTLTVTSASGKATLKWTNVADESGYEVVYATKKDGTYKSLGTTKANVVTLTKSLTKGTTYYFKVRAYKTVDGDKVYSNYSAVKSVKIK